MYRNYKIVICIAAGRRRYLEVLFKHLEKYRDIVDRVQLWMNTLDFVDRNFIKMAAVRNDWFQVIKLDNENTSINPSVLWHSVSKFYKHAVDSQTIYIKIDDDIVYLDDIDHFKEFLDFRIDNPRFFLVSANVLNNALLTREHQLRGHFCQKRGLVARCSHDKLGMYDGPFADSLHRQILRTQAHGQLNLRAFDFDSPIVISDFIRICINWIAWFGEDFAEFSGDVPQEDELWLTTVKSNELKRPVAVCPTFQVVHFSFASQHKHMGFTDVLNKYRRLAGVPISITV